MVGGPGEFVLLSLGDNANPSPLIVTRSHVGKLSKQHVKTRGGRGRKTQPIAFGKQVFIFSIDIKLFHSVL